MHIRFVFFAALVAASHALAFDLKGVEVGQPADASQLKTTFDFHFSNGTESSALRCVGSCGWGSTAIAGAGADISVTIDNHVLQEIRATFKPLYFDSLHEAFAAKYGKPTQTARGKAQTGVGAQLPVIIETWRNAAGDELVLTNFADGAHGALVITSKTEVDSKAARAKKQAGDI
jgi:hypothetical protein